MIIEIKIQNLNGWIKHPANRRLNELAERSKEIVQNIAQRKDVENVKKK